MDILIGNYGELGSLTDLSKVKKHQFDQLVDAHHTASKNMYHEVDWLGNTYSIQYAHYLIEYLSPKFKDML